MLDFIDYYSELGVNVDSAQWMIDDAYKAIPHPDWRQKEAYETLSNEDLRKQYNVLRLFVQSKEKQIDPSTTNYWIDKVFEVVISIGLTILFWWAIVQLNITIGLPTILAFIIGFLAFILSCIVSVNIFHKIKDKREKRIETKNAQIYARNKILYEQLVGEPYKTVAHRYEYKVFE